MSQRIRGVGYHGTSAMRWQGRWSVLLGHKGPQSPGVGMALPPWCTPPWLRTGQLPGEARHVLLQQMVDSSKQRSLLGVMESVWPGIHGIAQPVVSNVLCLQMCLDR
ncbi:uncharacterized protein LOC105722702 isoform X9 [Aotus nancymaae]|uniref:uncharacterized protein LOC105722702 isoform X9 n=1 Tax=Aotus nancymaae TaxID=37293 RepID=UPI0030FF3689